MSASETANDLYCLIVGVGRTEYQPWSLPVSEKDARAFESFVTNAGKNPYPVNGLTVLTNEDATRERILKEFAKLEDISISNQNCVIYIYYSGHGLQYIKKDGNVDYYLIPNDANPDDLKNTAIESKQFVDNLRKIASSRFVVFLDTCHAKGIHSSQLDRGQYVASTLPVGDIENLVAGQQGRAVILSSSLGQDSIALDEGDNSLSVFTSCLLDGLSGKAAYLGELSIGVLRIFEYLSFSVPKVVRQAGYTQQPIFECSGVTGNYPIAIVNDFVNSKKGIIFERLKRKIETRKILLQDIERRKQANLWALSRSVDSEQSLIYQDRIRDYEQEEDRLWQEIENITEQILE